jgi:hypothetical protein
MGVYTSQITAVVIDYFCIIIECTLTLYYTYLLVKMDV